MRLETPHSQIFNRTETHLRLDRSCSVLPRVLRLFPAPSSKHAAPADDDEKRSLPTTSSRTLSSPPTKSADSSAHRPARSSDHRHRGQFPHRRRQQSYPTGTLPPRDQRWRRGKAQRQFAFESALVGKNCVALTDIPLDNHDYGSIGTQTWGGACVLAEMIA